MWLVVLVVVLAALAAWTLVREWRQRSTTGTRPELLHDGTTTRLWQTALRQGKRRQDRS